MKTLNVALGDRSYPIYIGEQLISGSDLLASAVTGSEVLVISNNTVAPLYMESVVASLGDRKVDTLVLPDGERFKTQETLANIYQVLLEQHHSRKTTLVALGGGVVGDMTGFAAACYQRGVKFVQIPTTLLAQVDSSVGGKTGVNHPLGKNMIGAFHQPVAVIIDIDTLDTLPAREFSAGLAEVIKYGLIADPDFYQWLEANMDALMARDRAALIHAVEVSCRCKADVVARDEREGGLRAILNLGHTFGHAIETAEAYTGLLHGEAVAVGMLMAADMSRRLGNIGGDDVAALRSLLLRAGLPVTVPAIMTPELFRANMQLDKKVVEGRIRLVLLETIGRALISDDYPDHLLTETLTAFSLA